MTTARRDNVPDPPNEYQARQETQKQIPKAEQDDVPSYVSLEWCYEFATCFLLLFRQLNKARKKEIKISYILESEPTPHIA